MGRVLNHRTLRLTTLLSVAALALHQLRYLIGYGPDASAALARQGHGYLSALTGDMLGVAAMLLCATVLAAAWRSSLRTARTRRRPGREWQFCTVSLLAIFTFQELVEGIASSGHPAGLAALFTANGWIAIPLAALLASLVTAALRFLERVDYALCEFHRVPVARKRASACRAPHSFEQFMPLALLPLAFGFARRPPPLLSPSG